MMRKNGWLREGKLSSSWLKGKNWVQMRWVLGYIAIIHFPPPPRNLENSICGEPNPGWYHFVFWQNKIEWSLTILESSLSKVIPSAASGHGADRGRRVLLWKSENPQITFGTQCEPSGQSFWCFPYNCSGYLFQRKCVNGRTNSYFIFHFVETFSPPRSRLLLRKLWCKINQARERRLTKTRTRD